MRIPLHTPLLRSGTLAITLLVAALTVRCGVLDGSPDLDPNPPEDTGTGCTGTTGELGQFRFVPEEDPWANVSATHGGRAFAAGTREPFRLRPVSEDQPLPSLRVQSDDPAVFTVRAVASGPYPYQLVLGAAGTATLELIRLDDLTLYDFVELRVKEARGFDLWASPLAVQPLLMDDQIADPEAVVLAPAGRMRVGFWLTDDHGEALSGSFAPTLATSAGLVAQGGGRLSVNAETYVSAHLASVIATGTEGPSTLTVGGPTGATRTLTVHVMAEPTIRSLTLNTDAFPGFTHRPGQELTVSAHGWTPDRLAAFGYAVSFVSSDPRIVEVLPGAEDADSARVRFGAAGTATLSAYLDADPEVTGALEITVSAGG